MITNLATNRQVFTSNVFLVTGERNVLVDAGDNFDVVSAVHEHVDELDAQVLTHTHPDHVGNVIAVTEAFDVECWGYDTEHPVVDRGIADGDTVQLGDHAYEALFTPGHAVDHICFYSDASGILFAGDLIFANGGVGRTDFEGGDRQTLIESIDRVADRVGSSIQALHTGHGPSVTSNPERHVQMAQQAARTL